MPENTDQVQGDAIDQGLAALHSLKDAIISIAKASGDPALAHLAHRIAFSMDDVALYSMQFSGYLASREQAVQDALAKAAATGVPLAGTNEKVKLEVHGG